LVISGSVRGLSDRDIEAALAEVLGPEAALSRSTVSRICLRIKDEFEVWRTRDLSGVRLDYLFVDASHFRMHLQAPAEPVLAAWASIPTASRCSSASRQPASSESTDAWDHLLANLTGRGLRPPPGVSDDAPGLLGAIERHFPNSLRPVVPRAPRQERARQGIGPRPSRGQGRLLSDPRRR
jgi:putative transposase